MLFLKNNAEFPNSTHLPLLTPINFIETKFPDFLKKAPFSNTWINQSDFCIFYAYSEYVSSAPPPEYEHFVKKFSQFGKAFFFHVIFIKINECFLENISVINLCPCLGSLSFQYQFVKQAVVLLSF